MNTKTSVDLLIDVLSAIKDHSDDPEIIPTLIDTEGESMMNDTYLDNRELSDILSLLTTGPTSVNGSSSFDYVNSIIEKLKAYGIDDNDIFDQIKSLGNMMIVPWALNIFFPNLYSSDDRNVKIHINIPEGMNRFRKFDDNEIIDIDINVDVMSSDVNEN